MEETSFTYSVWAENSPGVLVRLCALFTRRKLNIESLTVSTTEVEGTSRFTIVVKLTADLAKKIGKQIERIVEVDQVSIATDRELIHSELAFFRFDLCNREYAEQVASKWGGRLIIGDESVVLEKSGAEQDISEMNALLDHSRIAEFIRSGRVAIRR